jgi:SAM-dependent methyltransferase
MLGESRMLTHQEAKAFYDHLDSKQDLQAFYEVPATNNLIAHAVFDHIQSVCEFSCGTGAFAERELSCHLPPQVRYLAVDSSATRVRLARSRLARFEERVAVQQTDGSLQFDKVSGACDRFVSNDVLDLLSLADIAHLLVEAHRLLVADGRLWQVESHPWLDPTCAIRDLDARACTPAPPHWWLSPHRNPWLFAGHRLSHRLRAGHHTLWRPI